MMSNSTLFLSGMDPAGPSFQDYSSSARLNSSDAEFVDIIHTHGKGGVKTFGTRIPLGHVDFYPNGGGVQPGCRSKRKRSIHDFYNNQGDAEDQDESELFQLLAYFLIKLPIYMSH